MKVPSEYLRNWVRNLDPGDKEKLLPFAEISNPTLTKAFKGEAKEKTIIKINEFFAQKKKRLEESFSK